MSGTVAALFVEGNGVYANLPDVDVWDEARDALRYAGPWPVVAHPPCSTWCKLAPVNRPRYGHAIGDDGGCFASALASVHRWGGVLEHPAMSLAWDRWHIVRPPARGWSRAFWGGGWVCEVSQRAYGHRAQKLTWLYAVVRDPPSLDWSRPAPEATCSFLTNHGGGNLPRLGKKEAKSTPIPFRDLLLSIARTATARAA